MSDSPKIKSEWSRFARRKDSSAHIPAIHRPIFGVGIIVFVLVVASIFTALLFQGPFSNNAGFVTRDSLRVQEPAKILPGGIGSSLSGEFVVWHSHDPEEENSPVVETPYIILFSGENFQLDFEGEVPTYLSGSTVRMTGAFTRDGSVVHVSKGAQIERISGAGSNTIPLTNESVLVILATPSNNPQEPYTAAQAWEALFGSSNLFYPLVPTFDIARMRGYTVQLFYQSASFSQYSLTGQVAPSSGSWLRVNMPPCCNFNDLVVAVDQAAAAQGINVSSYARRVYAFPALAGSGWTTSAYVGGTNSFVFWSTDFSNANSIIAYMRATAHEYGHNLGWNHSSLLACTDTGGNSVPISDTCSFQEYDNVDLMGGSQDLRHVNNVQKGQEGWLQAQNTITVTPQNINGTGVYTLAPIENTTTGIQALRIPRTYATLGGGNIPSILPSWANYYYLEFRQPYDFDYSSTPAFFSGAYIRISGDYSTPGLRTYFVRATPPNTFPLQAGQSFVEPIEGFRITPLSATGLGLNVKIEFDPSLATVCVHRSPTITFLPTQQNGSPGATLNYLLSITNNDTLGCGQSSFQISPNNLPSGLTPSPSLFSVNIDPSQTNQTSIGVASSLSSNPAVFFFNERVVQTAGSYTNTQFSNNIQYIIPDTAPPVVTITSPTNGATISSGQVTLSANVSDQSPIASVEFYINNSLFFTDFTAPYSTNVNANNSIWIHNANNVIRVVAKDSPPQGPPVNEGSAQITVFHT